jgi:hypothetical protein
MFTPFEAASSQMIAFPVLGSVFIAEQRAVREPAAPFDPSEELGLLRKMLSLFGRDVVRDAA